MSEWDSSEFYLELREFRGVGNTILTHRRRKVTKEEGLQILKYKPINQ